MPDREREFLFSYEFQGSRYSLTIPARTLAEALGRLEKMADARYDGEVFLTIGVPTGWVGRLLARLGLA